ncbi:coatomer WD associated region-domain-containing protein [Blastocladiella britannica]|nr:coatomer WD associated region-domain-containing protein [Blastocladiella britannica]
MLTKFESKSNRVKNLAFHPKRPWILASLYNGSIQWWDYRMGTLLDRFDEHEGPVRAIAFHPTQPIFASGGDDNKIRVWNYKQRRCLFTLHGHLDFVRTVQFHHEAPWILSCSDDYTIRIWNWQSRTCIAVLTGHHHYIMTAFFHPRDDLIVSTAYDFTIRVWDFSALRKKHFPGPGSAGGGGAIGGISSGMGSVGIPGAAFGSTGGPGGRSGPGGITGGGDERNGPAGDLFGSSDAITKFVLEGHDKCVNWAMFHPTQPLIVSGGDDRQIKIWRYSETKAWEVDTFRGHYNNVCSVLFHPRAELLLSAAEDKTIRVWDLGKRAVAQTFRREHDRFWVLVAHPTINLFAAGHDTGLIVFKLERERPAMAVHQSTLVAVQDKHLVTIDLATGRETTGPLVKRSTGISPLPRTLSFNPTERTAAIALSPVPAAGPNATTSADSAAGVIEIYHVDKPDEPLRVPGHAAVYVARNRLAVLDKHAAAIYLYMNGTKLKDIKLTNSATEMFYAGIGKVLLSTGTSVELWDVQQGTMVAELANVNNVKYVAYSGDMSHVALISKHVITLANAHTLQQTAVVHETIRVKSAVFDGPVLVYTTLNHVKYALPNGDSGILCTLEHPLYLAHVANDTVTAVTREHKLVRMPIDGTEYRFKYALITRQYSQVLHIIQNSNLLGQSIISYLQKKGYPEVALHFVQDPATRLDLALECGQLDAAHEAAKMLNKPEAWTRLAKEATRHGNVALAEVAMQRVQNLSGLSMLYYTTGQRDKLAKMLAIAQHKGQPASAMHNAILLGSIEDRARVLAESGLTSLAWLMCHTHGLTALADQIAAAAGIEPEQLAQLAPVVAKVTGDAEPELLVPRRVVAPIAQSWPLIEANRGYFSGHAATTVAPPTGAETDAVAQQLGGLTVADDGWGGAAASLAGAAGASAAAGVPLGGGGEHEDASDDWGLGGLDIPDVPTPTTQTSAAAVGGASSTTNDFATVFSTLPMAGPSKKQSWVHTSPRALDHVVAGSFDTAMAILNRTAGITHFGPLRGTFLALHAAAAAYVPGIGATGSLELPLSRNPSETDPLRSQPVAPVSLASIRAGAMADAAQLTQQNKLAEAQAQWRQAMQQLVVVADEEGAAAAVATVREYIVGTSMELVRRELEASDPRRSVELAAYFASLQLDVVHKRLALSSALAQANKNGYMSLAAHFARKLLDLNPPPQVAQKLTALIATADAAAPAHDLPPLDYDPFHARPVCAATFTAISGGGEGAKCRFCKASYKPEVAGRVCTVCEVAGVVV